MNALIIPGRFMLQIIILMQTRCLPSVNPAGNWPTRPGIGLVFCILFADWQQHIRALSSTVSGEISIPPANIPCLMINGDIGRCNQQIKYFRFMKKLFPILILLVPKFLLPQTVFNIAWNDMNKKTIQRKMKTKQFSTFLEFIGVKK